MSDISMARKVLGRLKIPKVFVIEAYSNGREQGFALFLYKKKIAFSENRNSDDLVVYVGLQNEFDMAGNIPNERVYRIAKYFPPNKFSSGISYIQKIINKEQASYIRWKKTWRK